MFQKLQKKSGSAQVRWKGNRPWRRVRKVISSLPESSLLRGAHNATSSRGQPPQVFFIPDFINQSSLDSLIKMQEARWAVREKSPRWCFDQHLTAKMLALNHNVERRHLRQNEHGSWCTKDFSVATSLADSIGLRITSTSVMVPFGENQLIDEISSTIDSKIGLNQALGYHTQLLRYSSSTNDNYKRHTDCHNSANDRAATVLVYLTSLPQDGGGRTVFPLANPELKVTPIKGSAVVFNNLDAKGRCDSRSEHYAEAVVDSESGTHTDRNLKLVLQRWYHRLPLQPNELYDGTDQVTCDSYNGKSGGKFANCRHYTYRPSRRLAAKALTDGNTKMMASMWTDATGHFRAALGHEPDWFIAKAFLAQALYYSSPGVLVEALARGLGKEAKKAGGGMGTGRDEALGFLREAVLVAPHFSDAQVLLGLAAMEAGSYAEAETRFEMVYRDRSARSRTSQARQKTSKSAWAEASVKLAVVLGIQGKIKGLRGAVAVARKAAQIMPQDDSLVRMVEKLSKFD